MSSEGTVPLPILEKEHFRFQYHHPEGQIEIDAHFVGFAYCIQLVGSSSMSQSTSRVFQIDCPLANIGE